MPCIDRGDAWGRGWSTAGVVGALRTEREAAPDQALLATPCPTASPTVPSSAPRVSAVAVPGADPCPRGNAPGTALGTYS